MRYDLLVCDFDGTLANTREAVHRTIGQTLGDLYGPAHGLTAAEIEGIVATGTTLPGTFAHLFTLAGEVAEDAVDRAVLRYREIYAASALEWTHLYPGVRSCLEAAHASGLKLAVISNKGETALRAALQALGIADFFDLIVGEQANMAPKPSPDVFERHIAVRYPAVETARMLVVGDTPADLQLARNVNIDGCWAAYGHGDPEACRALLPVFEISCFSELQGHLGLRH